MTHFKLSRSTCSQLLTLGVVTAALMASTTSVWAQVTTPTGGFTGISNPAIGSLGNNPTQAASGATFLRYFVTLWRAFITVGGLATLYFFLWGALGWILAGGDAGKIQKARDRIVQALIGMMLLVTSFVIIGFVSQLLFGSDFDLLNLKF